MTQQPFSRPGAVDLSSLKRPAPPAGGQPPAGRPSAGGAAGSYAVDLDEQNIQGHLESSMNAPVLMAVYSASQDPESVRMVRDLDVLADEFEGRFLLGKVDVDTSPQLAQALQVPSVPLVALVVQGRMMPLLQDAPQLDELRALITQVLEQMATQGVTGRHQPLSTAAAPE
ncbi:hypothetical protein BH10ACT10_BH10ACT10_08590 [soil metagenome]